MGLKTKTAVCLLKYPSTPSCYSRIWTFWNKVAKPICLQNYLFIYFNFVDIYNLQVNIFHENKTPDNYPFFDYSLHIISKKSPYFLQDIFPPALSFSLKMVRRATLEPLACFPSTLTTFRVLTCMKFFWSYKFNFNIYLR